MKYPKTIKQIARKMQNKIPENCKISLAYAEAHDASVKHYSDDWGLEAATQNKDHPGVLYRKPSLMLIICATATTAYTLESGVKVIPVGCLRD